MVDGKARHHHVKLSKVGQRLSQVELLKPNFGQSAEATPRLAEHRAREIDAIAVGAGALFQNERKKMSVAAAHVEHTLGIGRDFR